MSGRTEWGVPGQASAAPCNEGGFYAHPVPLDGSMQLGAGASLGAAPERRGSPDRPAAPRVPAAVRGFGVDKKQSYLSSRRGSGLTAWAGIGDTTRHVDAVESSHALLTGWGASLCAIQSLVVRELKVPAAPKTAGRSEAFRTEAAATDSSTAM